MRIRSIRIALFAATTCLTFIALQGSAGAVLSGTNGNILFTSGRDVGDAQAKLYLRSIIGSQGAGSVSPTLTPISGVQYKHATWSPDRTKIVYAAGTPGASYKVENFDIYIQDLTNGNVTPITPVDSTSADRPAWSPDGTRIVYEGEVGTNDAGGRDLFSYNVTSGLTTNITNTPTTPIETDAAWTPDSLTLYYQTGDLTGSNNLDIYRNASDGSGTPLAVESDLGSSEFQPSISPDGTKFCWTVGSGFNSSTFLVVAPVTAPASGTILASDVGGNIDCMWSPDGTKIAYTAGVFSSGALVMKNSDGTGLPIGLTDAPGAFDGNADWAPDGKPECNSSTVATVVNKTVTIPLSCADTGPAYEQTNVQTTITTPPTVGTLAAIVHPATLTPVSGDTVVYTPKANFVGTDTFKFNGFDERGFATPPQTVTVNVTTPSGSTTPPPAPVLSKFTVAKTIKSSRAAPKLQSKRKGSTISFKLNVDATVTLAFKRTGKPGSSKTKGSFKVSAKAGTNRISFHGKLSRKAALALGKYKISISAVGVTNLKSAVATKRFQLK